jgi:guanylate kinase
MNPAAAVDRPTGRSADTSSIPSEISPSPRPIGASSDHRAGVFFVLSGPAGSGKTALMAALRDLEPEIRYCITATTRPPRPGERDGVDYYFLSREEFLERVDRGDFLEYAEVPPSGGNLYGSPRQQVIDALAEGRDVLLQVDVQGARSVRALMPATTIFLCPPDVETLRRRLISRGTERTADMERRLANAEVELCRADEFDYTVVNADGRLDDAVNDLRAILARERRKRAGHPPHMDG